MFNLSKEDEQRAKRLHKESLVVDSLAGFTVAFYAEFSRTMLQRLEELIRKGVSTEELLREMDRMHVQEAINGVNYSERERMELSGVDAFSMTVGETPCLSFSYSYESALRDIALWTRKFDCLDY